MPRRSLCVVLFLCLLVPPAAAQWQLDGNILDRSHVSPIGQTAVADDEGGAFFFWHTSTGYIRGQHVDAHGHVLWGDNGLAISSAPAYEGNPKAIADGEGGAIVVYQAFPVAADLYAQRVDAQGILLWEVGGVAICTASGDQGFHQVVGDGMGGALIAWEDYRAGNGDIYAQRIDGDGSIQFEADGKAICTAIDNQFAPVLCGDGMGGAIIAWTDNRNGSLNQDIYAALVWFGGTMSWTADGVAICTATELQRAPVIVSDGAGGAIVAWEDYRSGQKVYAQRVDPYGNGLYVANGQDLCSDTTGQRSPVIASDGAGGAIVCWRDSRGAHDIYGQRISSAGLLQWDSAGAVVIAAARVQEDVQIVADGVGGVVCVWEDNRHYYPDIYAQRMDPSGNQLWDAAGVALCTANYNQYDPFLCADGEGGAIVVWRDLRDQGDALYAQRIERNGNWGYPAGYLASAKDVPGDQGGVVHLSWYASRLDAWPTMSIDYYSLWRALGLAKTGASVDGNWWELLAAGEPVLRTAELNGQTWFWEPIGTQDAMHLSGYAATVSTLFDSTAISPGMHYFQVIAHGVYPGEFWISPPDSARSVDNLAPALPKGFVGEASYDPAGLSLLWNANHEIDLLEYRLYRGSDPDFVPDAGSLLSATPDTTGFDAGWSADSYYKLIAVDVHGNLSAPALLVPELVTSVPPTPGRLVLSIQAVPNPFNPRTTLVYTVPSAGEVSLELYDVRGRRVDVLLDRRWHEAGEHRLPYAPLGASGVYFLKVSIAGQAAIEKITLVK